MYIIIPILFLIGIVIFIMCKALGKFPPVIHVVWWVLAIVIGVMCVRELIKGESLIDVAMAMGGFAVSILILSSSISSLVESAQTAKELSRKEEIYETKQYRNLCAEVEQAKQEAEQAKRKAEQAEQEAKEEKAKLRKDREAFELEMKQRRETIEQEAKLIIDKADKEAAIRRMDAEREASQMIEHAEAAVWEKVKNIFALNKKVGDHADPIRAALYEECRKQAERLLENVDPSRIRNATSTDLEVIRVQINLESSLSATIRSGNKTYETTLHGCKCPDSDIRKNLCKHTIFLAHAIGVFETIPEETFEKAFGEKGETQ